MMVLVLIMVLAFVLEGNLCYGIGYGVYFAVCSL